MASLLARIFFLLVIGLAGTVADASDEPVKTHDDVVRDAATLRQMAPGLVRVEYMLQYDRSETPDGWTLPPREDAEALIEQERPAEVAGFLLSPTTVVTADPILDQRFIRSIQVRFGDDVVSATPSAWASNHRAILLELERPLQGAAPFQFTDTPSEPFRLVTYIRHKGFWVARASAMPTVVAAIDTGEQLLGLPSSCIIVDENDQPVGVCLDDELPLDDSWQGSPLHTWTMLDARDVENRLRTLDDLVDEAIMRVALSFRSPQKTPGQRPWMGDEAGETERNVVGMLIDPQRILVLEQLKPQTTSRLERIRVFPPDGEPITATFDGSLRDYGAFIATLERPISGALVFSAEDPRRLRDDMLLSAEVRVQGENRVAYFFPTRLMGFTSGWRGQMYPNVPADRPITCLFDTKGALLALPIARRRRISVQDRWGELYPAQTLVRYLAPVLDDPVAHIDPHNVPLAESDENRIAWMGVELQSLDAELARVNNLADQTQDGATGAIVTYIYPGSPAETSGLQQGDILLRLHAQGEPKPLEVVAGGTDSWAQWGGFPWARLDELPEDAFEQVPTPWASIENSFNRRLTNLGFNTKFTAEVFRYGEIMRLVFVVTQSPPHYESAPRFATETDLGITVRDTTFEVRRYFRQADDEPGVIVSMIEPGSKAAIAGLKPFERITHVNDEPIADVGDFEEAISTASELRLAVKRMTRGRIVKIKLENGGDVTNGDSATSAATIGDEGS